MQFVTDARYRVTRAFRAASECDLGHLQTVTLVTFRTRMRPRLTAGFHPPTWADCGSLAPNTHMRTRKQTRDVMESPT